jgi:hypothetical protein
MPHRSNEMESLIEAVNQYKPGGNDTVEPGGKPLALAPVPET